MGLGGWQCRQEEGARQAGCGRDAEQRATAAIRGRCRRRGRQRHECEQQKEDETGGVGRCRGEGRGHGVGTILVTWPPDPPVPSASLPSESSISGGPPRLSVLPAPSAHGRGPPGRTPSRRGRISLFTLSASQLPFLGARGHKRGSGQGGRRDRRTMSGMQRPGKPSRIPDLSWAGLRAQAEARSGGPWPRGKGPLTWSGAGAQAPARGTGP